MRAKGAAVLLPAGVTVLKTRSLWRYGEGRGAVAECFAWPIKGFDDDEQRGFLRRQARLVGRVFSQAHMATQKKTVA